MKLGTSADGRVLTYDADRYEFRLSKQLVSFDDMRALDARDWIRWRAPVLREWFQSIDRDAFYACNQAATEQTVEATAVVHPNLRYRSTNTEVATVDAAGYVSICGNGSTDILAARMSDENFVSAVRLVTIVVDNSADVRELHESFKAKGGALVKQKALRLPLLPENASGYEKVSGSDWLAVLPEGKVVAMKGTPRGLHTAEVAVRGVDASEVGYSTILVNVEVK